VRYFPDKLPIGVDRDEDRHVFLYLVTGQTPMDFRGFLLRHAELLCAVFRWTVQLVVPAHLAGLRHAFEAAVRTIIWPLRCTRPSRSK